MRCREVPKRVCEQAGVSPASFYQWQRKLRVATAPTRNGQPNRLAVSRLVPVHIVADPPIGRADSTVMLEIELPGEIRLRIPAGYDPATLQVVMSLLLRGDSQEGSSC